MRKAIYSATQRTRVISVANGLWQLQQREGEKGINADKKKGVRHFDPWFNRGQPQERDAALFDLV